MDHGFFAIDVLACIERVDGNLFMPVIRCGDDHGIDVFSVKDIFIMFGSKDIIAPLFPGGIQPACIKVAYGNQFYTRHLQGGIGIVRAHATCSDQRNLEIVVGGQPLLFVQADNVGITITAGKCFCIFYTLLGIPIFLIMFQSVGERLNSLIKFVLVRLKKKIKMKNQDVGLFELITVEVFFTMTITVVASYVFMKNEDWSYFDSMYYCFITLTTIGMLKL